VLRVAVGLFAPLMPLAFVPGLGVSSSTPAVKPIWSGGRLLITYYESQIGPVVALGLVVAYFTYAYLLFLLCRTFRRAPTGYLLAIIVGQTAYCASVVNDGLVAARVYSFVYLSEYGYLAVIMSMAFALLNKLIDLDAAVERSKLELEERVREAVADIKILRGLIPICAGCKKIRDDQGYWRQLEVYLEQHSAAIFSHGLCPDCAEMCRREAFPDR
jgi:hypothetical protein